MKPPPERDAALIQRLSATLPPLGPPASGVAAGDGAGAAEAARLAPGADHLQRLLATGLGEAAAEACRPWLLRALGKGGTYWHSASTGSGTALLTLTLLEDADQTRHALLTLDRSGAEAALDARLAAARLDAMISTAGALCHTVNNALTALLGNAEMLLETEGLPPDAQASAELILRAGERLDRLTSRTLRLGRARHPGPGRCDPAPQLERLCATLSATLTQAEPAGPAFEVDLPRQLGLVLADPVALEEAVTQLLRNAMKAAGAAGKVRLTARRDGTGAWPGFAWLRLTVEDDGPGLPAWELAFPGAGFLATTRSGGAHPLGLAGVRAFATALGGRLEASSSPLGGARLMLNLPVLASGQDGALPAP